MQGRLIIQGEVKELGEEEQKGGEGETGRGRRSRRDQERRRKEDVQPLHTNTLKSHLLLWRVELSQLLVKYC